jgi:hypothetical protein
VQAAIVKQREQIEASYAEAARKNERAAEPASLVVSWDDVSAPCSRRPPRDARARHEEQVRAHRHAAGDGVRRPRARLGRGAARRAAGRRDRDLRRALAGARRRVIEMLADYQVPAAPIDRGEDAHASSVLVAVGHLSKGLPPARRGAAALGRDRRLRRGARHARAPPLRARRRSSPTSAISRSAISSSTSTTASASSSA